MKNRDFFSRQQPTKEASAFFTQPFTGEAGCDEIRATAFQAELFAICLDLDGLADGLEAEPPRHAVIQQLEMRVLELHHPSTVDADEMIVRWLVVEIWIIGRLIFPEVYFPQQICFHQQPKRAVNRGSRGLGIQFAGAVKQFIGREMLILREGRLDDGVALTRPAHSFAPDEIVESFLDSAVH
jgi:hypothetical protein